MVDQRVKRLLNVLQLMSEGETTEPLLQIMKTRCRAKIKKMNIMADQRLQRLLKHFYHYCTNVRETTVFATNTRTHIEKHGVEQSIITSSQNT